LPDSGINKWRINLLKSVQRMRPGFLVIISFTAASVIGAALLTLPAASTGEPLAPMDALFTATSAVCVTGLVVVDTGTAFTGFGKTVILALIQLGGLGVMTFSVFLFLFLGKGVGMKQRWVVTETFTAAPLGDIRSLIKSIFIFTIVFEFLGALSLFLFWNRELPAMQAIHKGVFHSVSAFCNAGFATFGDSLMRYAASAWVNTTLMLLIIAGGIGYPVMYEFRNRIMYKKGRRRPPISLHSKMVISTSAFLIFAGSAVIYLAERSGQLAHLSTKGRLFASLFQSVTARTAGFNTLDIAMLNPVTLFILVMLMFVGASPGSCGGGVKTTTLAVFAAIFKTKITGRKSTSLFMRSIPEDIVSRALAVFILAVLVVTAGVVLLLLTEMGTGRSGNEYFLAYLFEAVSAFGTVGLSTGITPALSTGGKGVIIVMMLLGRVGLLTVAYIITRREEASHYTYAEEKVMIG
jgi:trk system potassium uptake protein TrkH